MSAQAPHPSRVDLRFDHWYDYAEMTEAMQALTAAYPELLTMRSLGKSVGDRNIWLITLNNPKTGSDREKTAMFTGSVADIVDRQTHQVRHVLVLNRAD